MCANIERIKKLPDEPSYFNKMVWMKANYKSLTEGCEDITAIWPSFGVTSVRIGQVRE